MPPMYGFKIPYKLGPYTDRELFPPTNPGKAPSSMENLSSNTESNIKKLKWTKKFRDAMLQDRIHF